jgi:hypothetical protein
MNAAVVNPCVILTRHESRASMHSWKLKQSGVPQTYLHNISDTNFGAKQSNKRNADSEEQSSTQLAPSK